MPARNIKREITRFRKLFSRRMSVPHADLAIARQDLPYRIGKDLDEAVAFNTSLGPAAEVLRGWGDRASEIRPKIEADMREALKEFVTDDGAVVARASTWAVTAMAPE